MAVQATADEVYGDMRIGHKIFLRMERGDVYTSVSFGLKNGRAICPYSEFQQGDHVFRMSEGCPQMIGRCENVFETYCVPPNNAMLTANISLIKLNPGFQVDNRLDFVWENENKSLPLEIYRGTIPPQAEVIIHGHGEMPQPGLVVSNPYSNSERKLFQIILVSGQASGAHPIREPVDQPLFVTSIPQAGSVSLDIYGTTTGMVGDDYAVIPLYPCLYHMYGSSLGSFDSGFLSV